MFVDTHMLRYVCGYTYAKICERVHICEDMFEEVRGQPVGVESLSTLWVLETELHVVRLYCTF